MQEFTGIIEIEKISNRQVADVAGALSFVFLTEANLRIVHYSDCQQMIIWLPQPGVEYSTVQLLEMPSRKIQEEWPVSSRLNGSIQILWDTLYLAPGHYRMEIHWKNDAQHQIEFVKREAGVPPAPTPVPEVISYPTAPIVYRDGFGKVIEEQDQHLQRELIKDLKKKFGRHLEYTGSFRGGTINYIDGETKIGFSHEMGGGNCMFYIDIPDIDHWEAMTKTSPDRRQEIITYLAETVKREQAPGCRFEIGDSSIVYYYR